ncbi:DUF3592 domain-containing protein [Streptomyces sp. SAI-041]|uniref:Rv1733c family protein n=1 Tax=Streptomyces sp. SAI-041 TaxID=2940548 RepID=UPI0024771B03|nr:DUF3592 domain-containing protein [Streptomyces sp. SAI-041]MDH6553281.1 hypothetical protein [Streptomyces sp. SAI-041]
MGTRVRGWRWRRNPLRRRSDVVEAWTVLAVAVLMLLGAPLIGAVVGGWAHDDARAVAAEQRAERHRVRAEVVGRVADSSPTVQGGRERSYRATVRWTDAEGATRTATARVPAGTDEGEKAYVWFDSRGRSVAAPPDGTAIWQHTLVMGACGAGATIAVILFGHCLVRRVAARHRLDEWERDWALTEPQWTRRRA